MRIPELQRILVDAALREAQPTRRVRFRRRPVALVLAVLLLGGTAAAAVVSLTSSRPLTGTLPAGTGPLHTAGRVQYRISVFPYLSVGWAGWCSSVRFSMNSHSLAIGYGCGPVENAGPLVLDGGDFGGPHGWYQYEIVSDRVAAVRYSDGATLTPISDPRLPAGTRAVVRVAPLSASRKIKGAPLGVSLPPSSTLLGAHGQALPVPQILRANAVEHLPLRVVNPSDPVGGGCAIRMRSVTGLVALSQTVITPVPWPRREVGAFLACANATYRLGNTTLAAAVLVNATNPQQGAPPLPGLVADNTDPGILVGSELGSIGFPQGLGVFNGGRGNPFDTPTRHQTLTNHDISARRAGRGWLIAESGTPTQRATLLAALTTGA